MEIQHSAAAPSVTVPSEVNDPSALRRYVVTELLDASVATTSPLASKAKEKGRAFTASVTTGAVPSVPLLETENTSYAFVDNFVVITRNLRWRVTHLTGAVMKVRRVGVGQIKRPNAIADGKRACP